MDYTFTVFVELDELTLSKINLPEYVNLDDSFLTENLKMVSLEIKREPTYLLLKNQFSFQRNIEDDFEGCMPFSKFLNENEIKSLSYFDYSNEKIYRLSHLNSFEFEQMNPNDLFLISEKLIEYLKINPLISRNDEALNELKKINRLAKAFFDSGLNFIAR